MPVAQRVEVEKPWFLIALATILVFVAVACLLIRNATAPVGATPPAAGPSYRAEREPVAPDAAEAAQRPAAQLPAARTPPGRAWAGQASSGAAAPDQDTDEPTADPMSAAEQSTFKARRALETIDPRELLRASVPPAHVTR